ncbi:cytochrome c oxidase assembly protein [Phreatobacter cathodiphilus]|uniref:Cytochrome c oxidase assembly protein CtaG n=1 Tax=Phreatobacter cathodiphilus TaxID=1868589 RepID=A0A2S0N638_9HYPH|nr:cytochrome c oxidase assembly protein [Phreatobacter cathodiphilus]AVO43614.1 cytochrome c oxidase assembly protein [Phreatobacter cathodiphilus]
MSDAHLETATPRDWKRDLKVASAAFAFGLAMFGAAYAAVPLYDLFCRVTGFGGTTMRAERPADRVIDHPVDIRFDSNIGAGLPWRFQVDTTRHSIKAGETHTMTYKVTNLASVPVTGMATYNVAPAETGRYFNKLECFCFTEQTLAPGESREFTVVYFVDPAIADDPSARTANTITLSYTFYRQTQSSKPVAQGAAPTAGSRTN